MLEQIENLRLQILKEIGEKNEKGVAKLLQNLNEDDCKKVLNPNINYRETYFKSDPLHFAIGQGLLKTVKLFLPYIEDINRQPYCVGTPLHHAAANGFVDIVNVLLTRKDVNLNAKDYWHMIPNWVKHDTPLHVLTYRIDIFGDRDNKDNSKIEVMKVLLSDPRTQPNVTNATGDTPLEMARKKYKKSKHAEEIKQVINLLSKVTVNPEKVYTNY